MNWLLILSFVSAITFGLLPLLYVVLNRRLSRTKAHFTAELEMKHSEHHNLQMTVGRLQEQVLQLKNTIKQQDTKLQELTSDANVVNQEVEFLKSKIQVLESNNSENKLYTRAKKMISMGADIDEVIQDCEISRAEAELLFSLNAK